MSSVLQSLPKVFAAAVLAVSLCLAVSGCSSQAPAAGGAVGAAVDTATDRESVAVSTYNIQAIGTPGSVEYSALVDVLRRVDADVVLLQEVNATRGDLGFVDDLARDAGYPFHCLSEVSGTLSGGLYQGGLSRVTVVACDSWSAAELSGDLRANDISRDVFQVTIRPDGNRPPWAVFSVHLKGGRQEPNRFRRQIEIRRVLQAIGRFRDRHPGAPVLLAGDFNEDIGDGPFGKTSWTKPPAGLPRTYRLGQDVAFPVVYDPFAAITEAGLEWVVASHDGAPGEDGTRWRSGRRLDYLAFDAALTAGRGRVYDSCDDRANEDGPPLACGRTGEASDHFQVIVDVRRKKEVIR